MAAAAAWLCTDFPQVDASVLQELQDRLTDEREPADVRELTRICPLCPALLAGLEYGAGNGIAAKASMVSTPLVPEADRKPNQHMPETISGEPHKAGGDSELSGLRNGKAGPEQYATVYAAGVVLRFVKLLEAALRDEWHVLSDGLAAYHIPDEVPVDVHVPEAEVPTTVVTDEVWAADPDEDGCEYEAMPNSCCDTVDLAGRLTAPDSAVEDVKLEPQEAMRRLLQCLCALSYAPLAPLPVEVWQSLRLGEAIRGAIRAVDERSNSRAARMADEAQSQLSSVPNAPAARSRQGVSKGVGMLTAFGPLTGPLASVLRDRFWHVPRSSLPELAPTLDAFSIERRHLFLASLVGSTRFGGDTTETWAAVDGALRRSLSALLPQLSAAAAVGKTDGGSLPTVLQLLGWYTQAPAPRRAAAAAALIATGAPQVMWQLVLAHADDPTLRACWQWLLFATCRFRPLLQLACAVPNLKESLQQAACLQSARALRICWLWVLSVASQEAVVDAKRRAAVEADAAAQVRQLMDSACALSAVGPCVESVRDVVEIFESLLALADGVLTSRQLFALKPGSTLLSLCTDFEKGARSRTKLERGAQQVGADSHAEKPPAADEKLSELLVRAVALLKLAHQAATAPGKGD